MIRKRQLRRSEISRQALRRAAGDTNADVSRLVEAVPEMMAEARRRRALQARMGAVSAVVPLARRAIPAMTAAAVVLATIATFVGFRLPAEAVRDTTELDRLILTGETSGELSDPLLEAMIDRGDDDG